MARYSAELRDIVESGVKVFDFEYEFYDENKKSDFENKFIDHFMFHEIGTETVGRFQHYLKVKCQERLPFYNEMLKAAQLEYEILYNYDMKEQLEKESGLTKTRTETLQQNGVSSANATTNGILERTADGKVNRQHTNTLDSTIDHEENTDVTRTDQTDETGEITKVSTAVTDGRKVDSDTPAGLLAMDNIKGNVYASKATVDDSTVTTTDTQTSETGTTKETAENTAGTAKDTTEATSVDTGTDTTSENSRETNNVTSSTSGTAKTTANTTQNETDAGTENYTLTRIGNIGVMHATDMIDRHVELQRKIRTAYQQFFNECDDLFMQIF